VDEITRQMLVSAATAAGQSVSGYLARAATDRTVRDAAVRYRETLAANPQLAADIDAARLDRAEAARNSLARRSAG
jgi:hypothetical protein